LAWMQNSITSRRQNLLPVWMSNPGMSVETDFLSWLQDNGAFVSPKLGFRDYSFEGAGRGLAALEDFKVY